MDRVQERSKECVLRPSRTSRHRLPLTYMRAYKESLSVLH